LNEGIPWQTSSSVLSPLSLQLKEDDYVIFIVAGDLTLVDLLERRTNAFLLDRFETKASQSGTIGGLMKALREILSSAYFGGLGASAPNLRLEVVVSHTEPFR
jgi:hypothetical protein